MVTAGIDVACKSVVLSIRRNERSGKARTFANSAEGHAALVNVLRKGKVARVCLEATGQYHLDLSLALDAAGLELMVLNPRVAKRFAESLSQRNKTDALDASVLAEFAQRMPFVAWQRPDANALAVRACARRLQALTSGRTQCKNQLHAAALSTTTPQFILDDLALSIEQIDAQIAQLRAHARAILQRDERLHVAFELLLSVKGIAEASAIQILGEILVLPADMKAKQWVAMAGLDPRVFESGTSVAKKPRLSKAGNRYLRVALYMPALSAARHEPNVRAYYNHLIETRGLKKIQAVCAVMRKLLHAIHAMLKTRQPFDGSRFCELPVTP
jgi:transposase